jgi:hypothetical protein
LGSGAPRWGLGPSSAWVSSSQAARGARHISQQTEGEEWLRKTLDELRELQSVLAPPKPRGVTEQLPPPPTKRPGWEPSWWKLGTAGSVASLGGVPLAIVAIVLAVVLR